VTPLDFAGARDDGSESWHRAEPARALLEQSGWNRWLVLLPDGEEAHEVRLERDHGAYVGQCDCKGFAYHDGPCAHLCTVRKAAFGRLDDVQGRTVEVVDGDEARADRAVERQMARTDGGWGAPR
jgi:hypothetical protein